MCYINSASLQIKVSSLCPGVDTSKTAPHTCCGPQLFFLCTSGWHLPWRRDTTPGEILALLTLLFSPPFCKAFFLSYFPNSLISHSVLVPDLPGRQILHGIGRFPTSSFTTGQASSYCSGQYDWWKTLDMPLPCWYLSFSQNRERAGSGPFPLTP